MCGSHGIESPNIYSVKIGKVLQCPRAQIPQAQNQLSTGEYNVGRHRVSVAFGPPYWFDHAGIGAGWLACWVSSPNVFVHLKSGVQSSRRSFYLGLPHGKTELLTVIPRTSKRLEFNANDHVLCSTIKSSGRTSLTASSTDFPNN